MIEFLVNLATLVLTGLSLIAFFITLDVFFSGRLDRIRAVVDAHPGRAFLIGLVNALFFGAIALGLLILGNALLNPNYFVIPALVILTPLGIGILFGAGGLIGIAGDRLFPGRPRHFRTILATALVYTACLAPIVGWFALSGYVALTGLGGFLLSFLNRTDPVESDQQSVASAQ